MYFIEGKIEFGQGTVNKKNREFLLASLLATLFLMSCYRPLVYNDISLSWSVMQNLLTYARISAFAKNLRQGLSTVTIQIIRTLKRLCKLTLKF